MWCKLNHLCSIKTEQKSKVSRVHHVRKIIMRKSLKLVKSSKPASLIKSQLVMFEKQLCDSHLDEKPFEENTAVTKSTKIQTTCCCLPTPMTLASGGVQCSRLWSTSRPSPSIWPAVQSLRRGLSTIQGRQCGAYVGAVV